MVPCSSSCGHYVLNYNRRGRACKIKVRSPLTSAWNSLTSHLEFVAWFIDLDE
jgi:hypothetical protein